VGANVILGFIGFIVISLFLIWNIKLMQNYISDDVKKIKGE